MESLIISLLIDVFGDRTFLCNTSLFQLVFSMSFFEESNFKNKYLHDQKEVAKDAAIISFMTKVALSWNSEIQHLHKPKRFCRLNQDLNNSLGQLDLNKSMGKGLVYVKHFWINDSSKLSKVFHILEIFFIHYAQFFQYILSLKLPST